MEPAGQSLCLQLLTPEDEWEALRLFNEKYEGEESVEEQLHLACSAPTVFLTFSIPA